VTSGKVPQKSNRRRGGPVRRHVTGKGETVR
jgi:hypothetical protein